MNQGNDAKEKRLNDGAPCQSNKRRGRKMEKRIWVLGATDPEMQEIEVLLRQAGEGVAYAAAANPPAAGQLAGALRRVRPDEAGKPGLSAIDADGQPVRVGEPDGDD